MLRAGGVDGPGTSPTILAPSGTARTLLGAGGDG